jgi:cytochrome c-type biogenesis protein CcmH/NrfG
MRQAAALELATPKHAVTPAPTLPAEELLGDLLMEQHRAVEALAAYQRSLALYPQRFNSLLGAARAARATGDSTGAKASYQQLLDNGAGAAREPATSEARSFTSRP